MKKYHFGFILVLCLFVVTGGVFATWAYNELSSAKSQSQSSGVELESTTTTGVTGTLSISGINPTIKIDDKGDHTSDVEHIALDKETITITFTPHTDYKNAQKNEYVVNLSLSEESGNEIKNLQDVNVFSFNGKVPFTLTTSDGGNTYVGVVTTTIFRTLIKDVTLNLPTHNDYLTFKEGLANKKITLTVSDDGTGFGA